MAGDGAPTVDCPACGEPNPGRARFCLACGEPLPSPSARPGGSRRAVTVVFSDLTGSTTLGERLANVDTRDAQDVIEREGIERALDHAAQGRPDP